MDINGQVHPIVLGISIVSVLIQVSVLSLLLSSSGLGSYNSLGRNCSSEVSPGSLLGLRLPKGLLALVLPD